MFKYLVFAAVLAVAFAAPEPRPGVPVVAAAPVAYTAGFAAPAAYSAHYAAPVSAYSAHYAAPVSAYSAYAAPVSAYSAYAAPVAASVPYAYSAGYAAAPVVHY